jgi:hypothetical protein
MGIVPGPENMNDAWGKTVHPWTMDRGFTVVYFSLKTNKHKMKLVQPSFKSLTVLSMYVTK